MKKITYILEIIFLLLLCLGAIMIIAKSSKDYERETAKMGVDWETNTCYLYWE